MMRLLRRLPPETAHNLALLALRTGLWRVGLVLGALLTLTWAAPFAWLVPLAWLVRWCEARKRQ